MKRRQFPTKVPASTGPGLQAFAEQGFTLLEVMIAVCIVGLLGASVLVAFQSQRKTHYEQRMIVEMHQNVRTVLFLIQRDVRMAGFDPLWQDHNRDGRHDWRGDDGVDNDCDDVFDDENEILPMGFISAETHRLWFRLDRNADGAFCGSQETVAYGFPRTSGGQAVDDDLDGEADRGAGCLNRGFTKNADASLILVHPVAENIQDRKSVV